MDGFKSAIEHAINPQGHWLEILDEGSALVAVAELPKASLQKFMGFAEHIHKDIRLWTGTFGKIGIPPMKFGMGVTVGEFVGTASAPAAASPAVAKISGAAADNSMMLAKEFCANFGVQLAVEGDLARFGEHLQEWIDLDDIELAPVSGGAMVPKRIFTKLIEREEPEDIQLLKSARKAFFQKDYADAKTKFDRLSRVKHLKRFAEIYLKRISKLAPKT
ncbi:MAG: hypothetical protein EOP06_21450 [Proteobacteria bacterium]|nr:MAG: hypothetical protein EOP06_21450 [Pseudomonadota bacterium]